MIMILDDEDTFEIVVTFRLDVTASTLEDAENEGWDWKPKHPQADWGICQTSVSPETVKVT